MRSRSPRSTADERTASSSASSSLSATRCVSALHRVLHPPSSASCDQRVACLQARVWPTLWCGRLPPDPRELSGGRRRVGQDGGHDGCRERRLTRHGRGGPGRDPAGEPRRLRGSRLDRAVRHARRSGSASSRWSSPNTWCSRSDYTSRYPYSKSGRVPLPDDCVIPDPLDTLAYVAGVTTTLGLATGLLVLPLHSPLVLAKRAATVDRLSRRAAPARRGPRVAARGDRGRRRRLRQPGRSAPTRRSMPSAPCGTADPSRARTSMGSTSASRRAVVPPTRSTRGRAD